MKRFLPLIIIAVVLLIAITVGWTLMRSQPPPPAPSGPAETSTAAIASGADPPHVRGEAGAPVTLEEFGDFQCPPCGALYPELKKVEHEYGARLRVIFRELPLVPMHAHAGWAARSAEAAGLQGRFWEMHDKLYENQSAWADLPDARPVFNGYARSLGLDMERFARDVESEAVDRRIFLDGKRAHALGIVSTPTLFLNGREVPFETFKQPGGLNAVIDNALSGTGR